MPATIKIILKDNAKEWSGDLKQEFAEAGQAADRLDHDIAAVNREMRSDAPKQFAKDIDQTGDAMGRTAGATGRATSAMGGMLKAGIALFALKEIVGKIGSAINTMAESGSASMQELQGAFTACKDAAVAMTRDPQFEDFIHTLSDGIKNNVVPAIKELPNTWRSWQDTISKSITSTGEYFGAFHEGTTQMIDDMRKSSDEMAAQARLQRELARNKADVDKLLGDEQKRRKDQDFAATLQAITDLRQIALMEEQEIARVKQLGELGKLNEEEKAASTRKLQQLDARRRQAEIEAAKKEDDERKKIFEEEKQRIEDLKAAEKQAAEERWKMLMENHAREKQAAQDAANERLKIAEQEAQAKREALAKAAGQQQGNVQQIVGGLTPQQIAQQVGRQREKEARQKFAQENMDEFKFAKSAGDEETMNRLRRQEDKVGAAARQRGFRDTIQGRADSDEITQAQQNLANKVIDNGEAAGRAGRELAAAQKEAVNVLAQQQRDLNQLAKDAQETRQQLLLMQGRGMNANQRAQMVGSGQ